ncbi:CHAT domain-containing tetratricopeptide repeat protein [Candidatus Protochlamydia sp. W-9]|uniref:CHAT domain-containing tetratricopeptide repeat protein n=1 Tax=Candidatus Protochlamydia sp. W-9 TaxID=1785087 RepID=UPI00096AB568|nr:CHAT domain-containing protein [Candidatus Protochlamydia sp. W-9]
MHVESVKFSTPYYLHYPLLPTLSLLDHVKGLIEAYKTKFTTEKNIIISAKLLLEEINQLEDICVQRECLCRLLKLEIEEIQNLIVEKVMLVFDFATFLYDIQHDQAQQLIHLEEIVSEIMEVKLKSNELNLIIPICSIYQSILEHLWLLPHLEFGNHCANLLIQNKNAILSKMERWKDSLDQLASDKRISRFIPKNLEKAVLRLFEPLPEADAKEIEEQKSVIHKRGEMTSRILEIMMKVCSDQGDFPRAIFHAKVFLKLLRQGLLEMFQKEEILVRIMQIYEFLAFWNQLLKQYQKAIPYSEKALRIAEALGDSYKISIYSKDIGSLHVKQGQDDYALPFYKKAQTIAKTLQDLKSKSQILTDLAGAYLEINKNDEAFSCFQAALSLTENNAEKTWIYTGIGRAYANAQQYKEAKKAYYKALEFFPQSDLFLAIKIHENLAALFNDFGRYKKAIPQAEKILELIQHPSIQEENLEALNSKLRALTILGSINGTFGDYPRELDYQKQALEINEKPNFFSQDLEIAYSNLGNAYCHKKNYSEGKKYYKKALEVTEETLIRARILVNLGHASYSLGSFPKALERYEKANKIGNPNVKKDSFNGLGLCYDAMGNKEQAIQNFENFICLSQQSEDRLNEVAGYHNLAELYAKFDLRLAEENYRKSIAVYSALHQELKNHHQWQITFFEEQAKTPLSLESFLLKQGKTEEALQITDFRRSRALVSALTKKNQPQREDFLSSGVTTQEMQALAHKMNTCLIVYSFVSKSTDSITAWIIPSHGEIICQLLPLGILTEEFKAATYVFQTFPFIAKARTIKTSLSDFLEGLTRGEPDENIHLSNSKAFKKRLKNWYEILIAPLATFLPKDPQQVVTIIPDGYLAQIPFAAFLDQGGAYLIEKHPLSIAPSIGILKLLDEIPKDFSKNSLVIGNPNTSEPGLKFAEEEAQTTVAPLLETAPEKILLQDKATVQRAVEGMPDARWIHLACHGSTSESPEEKLDPHSVFEGLFKLAPEQENPNGYLHAQEIAKLALRAELVFMSACFSGRGKLHGEGSVGPVWSFLAAGALSTVATYWRLPDTELTLEMVKTFYRHLLGIEVEKLNKAQALQKAMLVGIEQAKERPDRWGAFFLSGLYE